MILHEMQSRDLHSHERTPGYVGVLLASLTLFAPFGCASKSGEAKSEPQSAPAQAAVATGDATAPKGPAMWVARDQDTTVYLFGTVHILPPEVEWKTPAITAAFESADAVYFEADVSSAKATIETTALLPKLGMYQDGETLSASLDPEAKKELDEALAIVGAPLAMLDPMKPWLASMTLEQLHIMRRGYDPESGVEVVLSEEASAAGKPLRFLETAKFQLELFASLPEDDQMKMLVSTAESIEDDPDMLDELVEAWAGGDVERIAEMLSDPDAVGSEHVLEVLLTQRNANWVEQIQTLMAEESGVFFIAVGAGHLAGEEGVPAMLRTEGVEVTGP